MEAVMMNSTRDNKHRIGNPMRNFGTNRTLFPYPSDNLLLASFLASGQFGGGGLYPPAVSVFRVPQNLQHHRPQPPLLPLPISMPLNHQSMNIARSNSGSNNNIRLSPPRINKNVKNRGRDHSLTPKKSKNQKKNSKKEVCDLVPPATEINCATESSISEIIGPDPKDLPREVGISRVFSSSINKSCDEFSGSGVFTPSPPPSSLPLPTFTLRSKASRKAQAAVASSVDVGATDGLRRLLRI